MAETYTCEFFQLKLKIWESSGDGVLCPHGEAGLGRMGLEHLIHKDRRQSMWVAGAGGGQMGLGEGQKALF